MKLDEFPVNGEWTMSDWAEAFATPDSCGAGCEVRTAAAPSELASFKIEPDDVVEVVRFYGTSPEGWGSVQLYAVARLTGGRWASVDAWADTTGWGCQDGVTWWSRCGTRSRT